MKNAVVGWIFVMLVGAGLQVGAVCYRWYSLVHTAAPSELISSFTQQSVLTTLFAGAMLALLFWAAWQESGIEPPRPNVSNVIAAWVVMPSLVIISSTRGISMRQSYPDEVLGNMALLLCAICVGGLFMGWQAGLLGGNIGSTGPESQAKSSAR